MINFPTFLKLNKYGIYNIIKIIVLILPNIFKKKISINLENNLQKIDNIKDLKINFFYDKLFGKYHIYLFFGLILYHSCKYKSSLIFLSNYRIDYNFNIIIDNLLIKIMYKLNIFPSTIDSLKLCYHKHDDIFLSNWSMGKIFTNWFIEINNNSTFINNIKNEINIYANYPSFISMHLFLALIYIKNGFIVNFFYSTDTDSTSINNKYAEYIINSELNYIKKKIKDRIKFIYINTNSEIKADLPQSIFQKINDITYLDLNYFSKKYNNYFDENLYNVNSKQKKIYIIRKKRNLNTAKQIYNYLSENSNNALWILHNGTNVETGSIINIIKYFNKNFITFEYSLVRKKIFFSYNQIVTKRLTEKAWSRFIQTKININDILETKSIIKDVKYKFINKIEKENNSINNFNKNLITYIFYTNHPVESRYYDKNNHNYFESVHNWVLESIDYLSKIKCNIIIRIHPSELNDVSIENKNKLPNLIRKKFNHLDNLIIIDNPNFDTYQLFKIKNSCNVIYDSDIGLELILNNNNFISCGKTIYDYLNLGIKYKDKKDYFFNLKNSYNANMMKPSLSNRKLAFKFYIFWYNYIMHDFPCFIGNSSNQINSMELKKIFNNKKYGKPFELLFSPKSYDGWLM